MLEKDSCLAGDAGLTDAEPEGTLSSFGDVGGPLVDEVVSIAVLESFATPAIDQSQQSKSRRDLDRLSLNCIFTETMAKKKSKKFVQTTREVVQYTAKT